MAGGGILTGTADASHIEAPVTVKAYLICAFAAFGGIFGDDTGWIGICVLSARDQSLTTSVLSAGTFFGAIMADDIADFIGRRLTIIMGCFIFSVGCILETASTPIGVMVAGRLVARFGVGFISAIIILYMSEIAPRKVRGALVSGYQLCIAIGMVLANCTVYASQDRDDTGSYRIPITVQFLWAIILAVGLFFLPKSPRYFVKESKLEQAAKALSSVRGQPIDSEYIQDEFAEIIANQEYKMKIIPQTSYIGGWINYFAGSIWNGNSNLRSTIIGTALLPPNSQTRVTAGKIRLSFNMSPEAIAPFLICLSIHLGNDWCAQFHLTMRPAKSQANLAT